MTPGVYYVAREAPRFGWRQLWSRQPWRLAVELAKRLNDEVPVEMRATFDAQLAELARVEDGRPVRMDIQTRESLFEVVTVEFV